MNNARLSHNTVITKTESNAFELPIQVNRFVVSEYLYNNPHDLNILGRLSFKRKFNVSQLFSPSILHNLNSKIGDYKLTMR